jgi:hypothetical protein
MLPLWMACREMMESGAAGGLGKLPGVGKLLTRIT